MNGAFAPLGGGTVSLTASETSSRAEAGAGVRQVLIWNSGDVTVFLRFGDATVGAVTTEDMPIGAGGWGTFSLSRSTHVAAITAAGTAVVYITPGAGL